MPTSSATATPSPTVSGTDLLFADGFESGTLSAWSSSSTDGGDLSVNASAALVDSFGLQAVLDDNNAIFVTDETPGSERRYRVRFYFDPNSISMTNGDGHYLLQGFTITGTTQIVVLQVELRFSAPNYQVRVQAFNDNKGTVTTAWFDLTDAAHVLEVDWRAATTIGTNDGGLIFWLDGLQQVALNGFDNDTRRIDRVRLGAVAGIDSGTRGAYFFDAFEARWQSYIGP